MFFVVVIFKYQFYIWTCDNYITFVIIISGCHIVSKSLLFLVFAITDTSLKHFRKGDWTTPGSNRPTTGVGQFPIEAPIDVIGRIPKGTAEERLLLDDLCHYGAWTVRKCTGSNGTCAANAIVQTFHRKIVVCCRHILIICIVLIFYFFLYSPQH